MNINDFKRKIQEKQAEITKAIHRTLPIKIGRKAADHFQDNFSPTSGCQSLYKLYMGCDSFVRKDISKGKSGILYKVKERVLSWHDQMDVAQQA